MAARHAAFSHAVSCRPPPEVCLAADDFMKETGVNPQQHCFARWQARLSYLADSRWFAYLIISLLLLKTLWLIWERRDFSGGDSASYYSNMARLWHYKLQCIIGWSPLYTAYAGSFLWLTGDSFLAEIMHRVGITILSAFFFYAVLRRLVPPVLALFASAWWIVLPINHNSLYEVHFFSILPLLVAVLFLAMGNSPWHRGAAAGVLALSALLVRNEMIIATGLLASLAVGHDLFVVWKGGHLGRSVLPLFKVYAAPILLVALISGFFMSRSTVGWDRLKEHLHSKQVQNMNQMYSFSYQQRHPEWTLSPWTEFHSLMIKQFGSHDLTFFQAFRANPSAILEHFCWNLRLAPDGIALALFNARAGPVNPDYAPSQQAPLRVILLGGFCLLVVILGMARLAANPRYWWQFWIRQRIWPFIGLGCLALTGVMVLFMQRPRPSYFFGLSVALMVLVTLSFFILVHDWKLWPRIHWTAPLAMAGLVILFPAYWAMQPRSQPALCQVRALRPYKSEILAGKMSPIATSGYNYDICAYLDIDDAFASNFRSLRDFEAGEKLVDQLRERGFKAVLVTDFVSHDAPIREFEKTADKNGWRLTKQKEDGKFSYRLYTIDREN
jgi:hypothetical protein